MVFSTTALCRECLQEIPASLEYEDGVYLRKECPEHGEFRVLIEKDVEAYRSMHAPTSSFMFQLLDAVILNATDRCNQDCPHCYYMPGQAEDPSLMALVKQAEQSKREQVLLMGAEPTVRQDLPEVLSVIPKPTGIYTNGIRLSDPAYIDQLVAAGLDFICMSLHTEAYNDNPVIWSKKQEAMQNFREMDVPIHHVSWSLKSPEDILQVLLDSAQWWDVGFQHRVRLPGNIGKCSSEPLFMSEFFGRYLEPALDLLGWKYRRMYDDDNPYHINLLIDEKPFRFIRWASVDEVDLGELHTPPSYFVEGIGERNFMLAAILQAEKRRKKDQMVAFPQN